MKRHLRLGIMGSMLIALALSACGQSQRDQPSDTTAWFTTAAKWPGNSIPVCWESSASGYAEERGWVKSRVQDEFHSKTKLRFTGWGWCETNSKGIRIEVYDQKNGGPHVDYLGRWLDGVKGGMRLNFTFNNWSTSCKRDEAAREYCIKGIALHEFGHAIGMAHEHNRSDRESECTENPQGSDGDWEVTEYDADSVMNYCNDRYNNDGRFSRRDVIAINTVYGHPDGDTETGRITPKALYLSNTSDGKYRIRFYVDASSADLAKVEKVVYEVHPSLGDARFATVTRRSGGFQTGVYSAGSRNWSTQNTWVYLKDGTVKSVGGIDLRP